MKNRVTARSRTAIAERLKFIIWPLLFPRRSSRRSRRPAAGGRRVNRAYLKSAASDCASATYNWFGDSFFEASCRLGDKPTGRFLRVLKFLECIDSTPPQREHVETTVDVRRVAVE